MFSLLCCWQHIREQGVVEIMGYFLEWCLFMMLTSILYKVFGHSLEREDVYILTAIWGIANICNSLNK